MTKSVEPIYGDLPDSWQMITVGNLIADGHAELQTGPFGTMLHASAYRLTGTPVVAVLHLGDNRLRHVQLPRVDDETKERLHRYLLRENDIIFGRKGAVDRRALVRAEEEGWLQGSDCIRLRLNANVISPQFTSFALGSGAYIEWIERHAGGATMPSLNQEILKLVPLPFPPLPEQRAIARILGALDDKIELNRRMNHTLEEMAQAIFKSWFVDFDPVIAKAEGRQPYGMNAETAALFPSAFQDSELGPIPKGWQVKSLGSELDIVKGRSYSSSELQESDTALVSLKSIQRGGGYRSDGLKPFTGKYKPEQVLQAGELVVACTDITQNAEVVGRPAIIPHDSRFRVLVASLDLLILRPHDLDLSVPFLYSLMRAEDYANHIVGYASGTTVLHLSNDGVPSYLFTKPPSEILKVFNRIARPIYEHIASNRQSSATLATVRDALLPKLLSGEIRVNQAAEAQ